MTSWRGPPAKCFSPPASPRISKSSSRGSIRPTPNTRRWSWWRLYDAYGCAIRSYAFAARTGRLKRQQLNPLLLEQCENEIAAAGEDQLNRARKSAYGTSLPEETKRSLSARLVFLRRCRVRFSRGLPG